MQSKLHWNVVYHDVELLLLVSVLFLLAMPKFLLTLKEFWGAEGTPILFSDLGIRMASCSYM